MDAAERAAAMTPDELIAVIERGLEADEQAARAASPGPWSPNAESDEVLSVDGITVCDGFALSGRQLRATVEHIVRHDPSRVLAEVEAKRRILDEHEGVHTCGDRTYDFREWCPTLRALALPYAGRPGYREEWRP